MIAPDLAGLTRPIDSVHEDERNARTHNDSSIAAIARSLETFGQRKPIVALRDGRVIAGNGTLRAARLLGWSEVAVALFEDEQRATAYALADNQTALVGTSWDDEKLAQLLAGMSEAERGATGFSAAEIERMLRLLADDAGLDDAPAPPAVATTRPGDLLILGAHRVLCGDATSPADVSRALGGVQPFLMVTDPPYGVAYDPAWRKEAGINDSERMGKVANDDRVDWTAAYDLFPGEVAYVWHAGRHASIVEANLAACSLQLRAQIIWRKSHFAISRGHYHWGHEPCWYAVRDECTARWCGDRSQSTVWDIAPRTQDVETMHGTQKPVECMERPMRNHGAAGDVVYDPFLGSGTSLVAAERSGRVLRGLELDPLYCDVIVARWEKLTGRKAERRPATETAV